MSLTNSGLELDGVADLGTCDERRRVVDRCRTEPAGTHVFGLGPGPRAEQLSPESGFGTAGDATGYAGSVADDHRCCFDFVVVARDLIDIFVGRRTTRVSADADESLIRGYSCAGSSN